MENAMVEFQNIIYYVDFKMVSQEEPSHACGMEHPSVLWSPLPEGSVHKLRKKIFVFQKSIKNVTCNICEYYVTPLINNLDLV